MFASVVARRLLYYRRIRRDSPRAPYTATNAPAAIHCTPSLRPYRELQHHHAAIDALVDFGGAADLVAAYRPHEASVGDAAYAGGQRRRECTRCVQPL